MGKVQMQFPILLKEKDISLDFNCIFHSYLILFHLFSIFFFTPGALLAVEPGANAPFAPL